MPETAKCFDNRPILISGLEIYFEAYNELLTERSESGIISWSAIIKWAEFNEIKDKGEIKRLMRYIRAMEVEHRQMRKKDG